MKVWISILIMVATFSAKAQQTEQLTQYMFNQFGLNPAFAGLKECLDIRIGYRMQWVGFDDAPRTTYVNGNGRIFKRRSSYNEKHGVGGQVLSDATGPTSRTFVNLAYAYHFKVNRKYSLSSGISAGFLQYNFDKARVTVWDQNDPAVDGETRQFLVPDINIGMLLYSDELYAGFTIKQLWRNQLTKLFPDSRLTHHYYLNFGKKFGTKSKLSYVPSVLLKFTRLSIPSIDLNIIFNYKNVIAFGASYRNTDAIAALFKINFMKRFSLGYSFDLTTSNIRIPSSNTHEITLGMYSCPIDDSHNYECPVF